MSTEPTAAVIVIGDEILSGRTKDANLSCLATKLGTIGIEIKEARFIPDDEATIVSAVNELRGKHTYVFTTGGIGPTHDDITADSVAKAFGVHIDIREDARAILEAHYPSNALNQSRLRMARIPDGADLILNPVSKAPGFRLENVYVLPGIPMLVEVMVDGLLESLQSGAVVRTHSIAAFTPESHIAPGLGAIQKDLPQVRIGSYPFLRDGKAGTNLVCRSADEGALDDAAARIRALIASLDARVEAEERS
jgi:molybdenum cofactor synthesis domain-containing protein